MLRFRSPDWEKAIQLRREVLRIPLGLDFTDEELENENNELHFALKDQEKVYAIGLFRVLSPRELKMRQVAVNPMNQGKGIGKILITGMEDWAKKNQFSKIVLHARATALPFYQRLQYQIEGNEFEEVGIPHYYMFKHID